MLWTIPLANVVLCFAIFLLFPEKSSRCGSWADKKARCREAAESMMIELCNLLACPTCTYNRFMPSWYVFVLLRLAAVFMVARPRLDVVRTLGVVALLEVGYFYLWKMDVISLYDDSPLDPMGKFASWFTLLFGLGAIHGLTLISLSRLRWFQTTGAPPFLFRRALLIVPLFIGVQMLQSLVAYSGFSSSTGM